MSAKTTAANEKLLMLMKLLRTFVNRVKDNPDVPKSEIFADLIVEMIDEIKHEVGGMGLYAIKSTPETKIDSLNDISEYIGRLDVNQFRDKEDLKNTVLTAIAHKINEQATLIEELNKL